MIKPSYLKAILLTLVCGLFLSLIGLVGKQITQQLSIMPFIVIRFAMPAAFLALIIIITKQNFNIQWRYRKLYLFRAISMLLCQYCYFYYLQHNSLLNSTLLFCTGPLFVPLIARVWPGVNISLKTASYIMLAFIGVAMVLQPHADILNFELFIGLGSGFFTAISQVALHQASKDHSGAQISFIMCSLCGIFALLVMLFTGNLKSLGQLQFFTNSWPLFIAIISFTLFSIGNQLARAKAYSLVNKAVSIHPFLYSTIFFALVLDIIFYHIYPNTLAIIGAIVTIISCSMMTLQHKPQPLKSGIK
jgi:drug/metabolite transporter (DMT)-like permease